LRLSYQNAKAPGYEADDFLAAAVAAEKRRHGMAGLVARKDDAAQQRNEVKHGADA
jgi:hypothetical protein